MQRQFYKLKKIKMSKLKSRRHKKAVKQNHHGNLHQTKQVSSDSDLRLGVISGYVLPRDEVNWKIFEVPTKFLIEKFSFDLNKEDVHSIESFKTLLKYHETERTIDSRFLTCTLTYLATLQEVKINLKTIKSTSIGVVIIHNPEQLNSTIRLIPYEDWKVEAAEIKEGCHTIIINR